MPFNAHPMTRVQVTSPVSAVQVSELKECVIVYIKTGIMITEKCNLKCGHCMFSCTQRGKDMSYEVMKRIGSFIRSNDVTEVNVYGGEPFINVELFDKLFNEVYDSDYTFFVSSNGVFMTDKKRREYVFDLLNTLKHNRNECTGIRISNTGFHKECRTARQTKAIKTLEYMIDEPYTFYDYYGSGDEYEYAENPFDTPHGESHIYIDKDYGGTSTPMNPSGRALQYANISDRGCYCPMTSNDTEFEEDGLHLNFKPDGQVTLCCTCDGCSVANILEYDFSVDLILERITQMRKTLRKEYKGTISSDTRMADLCELCYKHRNDFSEISREVAI